MKLADAKAHLSARRMSLQLLGDEYRVTASRTRMPSDKRREDIAYYSSDLDDAYRTGLAMAEQLDREEDAGR